MTSAQSKANPLLLPAPLFTWTPILKPLWATHTVVAQLSESLEWVYAYRISEGDLFQKAYESEA